LGWDTWFILIPPEFTVPGAASFDASQITSTLTNSYDRVFVGKLSPYDRYAPGWTLVAITVDGVGNPGYNHQFLNFTSAGEWYYARINGVTAPSVAGRYFFKMFLYSSSNRYGVGPTLGNAPGILNPDTAGNAENPGVWVPPQNWPVMLVKGETDPAIITGTLRYAGYNQSLYQTAIAEAGKVWAHMTMRIDPYTGQNRPDLATIDAQTFVNATAHGHYELEGLAPGVYDIYAEAAGYPQLLCTSGITVLKGQSLHFDCYLQPGPVIHGNVFTKHQFGDEPWPASTDGIVGSQVGQYIKIELYDNPTLSNQVDPSANLVSWSPLPCVAGGQERYYGRRAANLCGDPRRGSAIAFPWHEYSTDTNVISQAVGGAANGYSRDVSKSNACVAGNLACTVLTSDPQGVGPPQQWYVSGGTTTPFHFEFGLKGEYGAPKDLSGEVPQVYATWINGLTAGRYYVRAWIFRYVQTALDGSTFQEYYFDVTPNEWAGDVTLPLDLRLSSWVNKTVYYHDTPNTIVTSPIVTGAGYLWGNLQGADGHVYAANVTNLGYMDNYYGCNYDTFAYGQASANSFNFGQNNAGGGVAAGTTNGFFVSYGPFHGSGEYGAPNFACPGNVNELNRAHLNADSLASGRAAIQFWGINDTWGGQNYGIPSGTYTPRVATNGYYSPSPEQQVSVTLSGNPTLISDHLFLGPGFNVSVYSIDWERPRVSRQWVWQECQTGVDNGQTNNQVFNPGSYLLPGLTGYGTSGGSDIGVGTSTVSGLGPISFNNALPACLGSEIDVGFYPVTNGTGGSLADYLGDETSFLPSSIATTHSYQGGPDDGAQVCNPFSTAFSASSAGLAEFQDQSACTEPDGGGRNVLANTTIAHGAYFGQSARYAFVGGYTSGSFGFLRATKLLRDSMFTSPITSWPLHFSEGPYNLAAYTYGYIQDKDFTAFAQNGQIADMKINLVIGVNVSLQVLFKKESIITPTAFNMSGRVRLFNDKGEMVAEWMSSEGTYVPTNGVSVAADGALSNTPGDNGVATNNEIPQYPFGDQGYQTSTSTFTNGFGSNIFGFGPQTPASHKNAYNFIPGGTTLLKVLMAGLPQQPPFGSDITGVYFGNPLQGGACDFELDCFPAAYAQYPFPYTGIAGAPDYTGGWTAEVDFVPWYANNTGTMQPGSAGAQVGSPVSFPQYYPPVNGLLMGESYHIIPGTTAPSGISWTEDMAMSPSFVGHSMAANHLGPYSQQGVWQIAGTHNSGEASAIFEVDLNGFVSGNVLAFTWSNEFRTLSWGTVSVTGASGATWNFYTYDGIYQAFLPTGQYKFTITQPGYAPQTWSYSVSPGQSGSGADVYLEQSNIPFPEFSGIAVVAFSALAASLYILRRRRV